MKKEIGWILGFWFASSVYAIVMTLSLHYEWSWWIGAINGFVWGIVIAVGVLSLSRDI